MFDKIYEVFHDSYLKYFVKIGRNYSGGVCRNHFGEFFREVAYIKLIGDFRYKRCWNGFSG